MRAPDQYMKLPKQKETDKKSKKKLKKNKKKDKKNKHVAEEEEDDDDQDVVKHVVKTEMDLPEVSEPLSNVLTY